ncbi:zona pellucida sperm-binding protein 1 [Myotis myotis]|uniref:zona pellucida sperm-binding protein 1 n=1 Tax=Myotis myotis TaxID=51298 RepID=UPI00174D12B4|nr:zona pellucida sperm-binding protein 1 [Myotis myotis]
MAMAGALTMAWDRRLALLLLVTLGLGQRPPPTPGFPGLRHSYDCGVEGMQLLVLPPEGRTVRFKVMDEFGNQFEVNNCSSCYHWVTAKPQGPAVFSADYKGCHVLEKVGPPPLWGASRAGGRLGLSRCQAGRPLMGQGCTHITQGAGGRGGLSPGLPPTNPAPHLPPSWALPGHQPGWSGPQLLSHLPSPLQAGRAHLSVFIEALLPDGRVDVAQNLTLVCPKPAHSWTTPDGPLVPSTSFSLSTPHTRELSPTTEPSVGPPTPASSALGPGPTHPTRAGAQGATEVTWGADKPEDIGISRSLHFPAISSLAPSHVLTTLPPALGTRPTPEQCRGDSGHIPCMAQGSSKEACQQAGCCYDNTRDVPCYYGNTATVQCFRDGHFVLVVSRETALAHRVTLANVHLAYAPTRCVPTQDTGAFVVFRFPFTHCGTTVQVAGNQLIYENQLVSDVDVQAGPQGAITRDGSFRLQVRCIFNGSDFLPLRAAVFPPVSPASVAQPGPLRLELRIAKDETFGSYYEERDYPLVRLLLEPVPVEVRLLQRTDPRLALVLHRCWATPGASPFQQPQWPLLSDGCPFEGDSYRTRLVALGRAGPPFPAHYQRFTVATFAFLDSGSSRALRGPVYFFCSASACSPSGLEPCSAPCGSRTARQRRAARGLGDTAEPQDVVSSPGPVGFADSYRQEPAPGATGTGLGRRGCSAGKLRVVRAGDVIRSMGATEREGRRRPRREVTRPGGRPPTLTASPPLPSAGSAGNSDPRLALGVALLLAAVALVLGIGVFVGLSRAQAPGLLAGSRG